MERRFDLGVISLPFEQPELTIQPLYREELLIIRPSPDASTDGGVATIQVKEMADAPFLLYPRGSNMRSLMDRYFRDIGITPRVIMEADDTEVIKRFAIRIRDTMLLQYAPAGRGHRFQRLRLAERRLIRQQALAMAKTEYRAR